MIITDVGECGTRSKLLISGFQPLIAETHDCVRGSFNHLFRIAEKDKDSIGSQEKKMKIDEKFLSLYKEYETALRNQGIDPKDYETQVDELTGSRLSVCRFFRNYMSHKNDPGFLAVSDNQIKFLTQTTEKLVMSQDVLKKHMLKPAIATCSPQDKCGEVLFRLAKTLQKYRPENLVVLAPEGVCLADIYDIALAAAESKTAKISNIKLIKKGFIYAAPTEYVSDLPRDVVVICTDDGTPQGKVLGVLYPQK